MKTLDFHKHLLSAVSQACLWLETSKANLADVMGADVKPLLQIIAECPPEKFSDKGLTTKAETIFRGLTDAATTYAIKILDTSVGAFHDFILKLADPSVDPESVLTGCDDGQETKLDNIDLPELAQMADSVRLTFLPAMLEASRVLEIKDKSIDATLVCFSPRLLELRLVMLKGKALPAKTSGPGNERDTAMCRHMQDFVVAFTALHRSCEAAIAVLPEGTLPQLKAIVDKAAELATEQVQVWAGEIVSSLDRVKKDVVEAAKDDSFVRFLKSVSDAGGASGALASVAKDLLSACDSPKAISTKQICLLVCRLSASRMSSFFVIFYLSFFSFVFFLSFEKKTKGDGNLGRVRGH